MERIKEIGNRGGNTMNENEKNGTCQRNGNCGYKNTETYFTYPTFLKISNFNNEGEDGNIFSFLHSYSFAVPITFRKIYSLCAVSYLHVFFCHTQKYQPVTSHSFHGRLDRHKAACFKHHRIIWTKRSCSLHSDTKSSHLSILSILYSLDFT